MGFKITTEIENALRHALNGAGAWIDPNSELPMAVLRALQPYLTEAHDPPSFPDGWSHQVTQPAPVEAGAARARRRKP